MTSILNEKNSLLLIIDIQEKLLNAQFNKESVLKNTCTMAEAAKILEIPVVVTEQYPRGLGDTVNEVKEKLAESTKFFEKTDFGCCEAEGFNDLIKGFEKTQVMVCGVESHVCVHQTVNELFKMGYDVFLIEDAITSRKEWELNQGIRRMTFEGAIPSCVEMALFELLKCAKHPKFKAVQSLIK